MVLQNHKTLALNEYVKLVSNHSILECEVVLSKFLHEIHSNFGQQSTCPILMVILDDKRQACYENGKIFLYAGLFKYLLEASSEDKLSIRNHNINHYFLCWVVAHEFAHFILNHNLIKITASHISNKAFEFGADRLAIIMVYSSFKSIFVLIDKTELKKIILIGLYYFFKNKTKSDGRAYPETFNTHPPWAMRMHYSIGILSFQDCPTIASEESKKTVAFLMNVLRILEIDYELDPEFQENDFNFDHYIKYHFDKEFKDLSLEYEKLRKLL